MKRTISLIISIALISSVIVFTACADNWYQPDPNMPDSFTEEMERVLDENLEILDEDPDNLDAITEVAYRYYMLGDYRSAVQYYEECLEQSPDYTVCLNNIATIYEKVEEYDLAAEYVKQLYELNTTDEEFLRDAVRILLKAGDNLNATQAIDYYEEKMITGEDEETDALRYEALIDPLREDVAEWEAENLPTE